MSIHKRIKDRIINEVIPAIVGIIFAFICGLSIANYLHGIF